MYGEDFHCSKCRDAKYPFLGWVGENYHRRRIMFVGYRSDHRAYVDSTSYKQKVLKWFSAMQKTRTGMFLLELFNSINLTMNDTSFVNLIKCLFPNDRRPRKREIENCVPHLYRQIEELKPKLIVTLGLDALLLYFQMKIAYIQSFFTMIQLYIQ
jgi:uracil-DNA glycosylase